MKKTYIVAEVDATTVGAANTGAAMWPTIEGPTQAL